MSFDTYISQFTSNSQTTLSNDQIVALFELFRNGDTNAFDKLIESNMRLVLKIANDYRNYGMDFEDIVSNGTMGLMKGIEHFNPEKGAFSQYVSTWIKKYIKMGFEKCRAIHTKRYDRMTEEEHSAYIVESLNEKIGDGETEFADALEADGLTLDEMVAKEDAISAVFEAIDKVLDKREQFIVRSRNGIVETNPMTLEEVASKLNCTRECVRQLEKIAYGKIRNYLER